MRYPPLPRLVCKEGGLNETGVNYNNRHDHAVLIAKIQSMCANLAAKVKLDRPLIPYNCSQNRSDNFFTRYNPSAVNVRIHDV